MNEITKAHLEKRLAELEGERERQLIATDNTYNGAIQEVKMLLALLLSDNNKKEK